MIKGGEICSVQILVLELVPMKNTSKILLFFSVLFHFNAFAERAYIELSQDRVIYLEHEIFNPEQPTLVLLPGINRGLEGDDEAIKILKEKKMNYVSFHFSGHPQSVIQAHELGRNPQFTGTTLETLKQELSTVVGALKIKSPLVVSLSYSGAVSMILSKEEFPLVIDAVPLGRQNENDSFLQSYYDSLQGFNSWNPFATAWLESMKEQSYTTYWTQQVSGLRKKYPALATSKIFESAVRGMVALSRAVEKFELENTDFSKGPERVFLFAENEDAKRLNRQRLAVQKYNSQMESPATVFLFKEAGHVLPSDVPKAFVRVLSQIISGNLPAPSNPPVENLVQADGRLCEDLL